jgi:antitoxin component of MazEF toxin-antitoxin module
MVKTKTLPFTATVRHIGNSWVVTLPKDYIRNGLVKPGKVHELTIKTSW